MQEYVLGFLFNVEMNRVVLIRKNKPEWQAGKLNGIGGKIEPHEVTGEAMLREFKEETGVGYLRWLEVATLKDPEDDVRVYVFAYYSDFAFDKVRTTTDEQVTILTVDEALRHPDVIPNLRWLIPLCIDALNNSLSWQSLDIANGLQ